jgi:hypothetical protein
MTERMMERALVRGLADEERPVPCVVRHEDVGGLCEQDAVEVVYGLDFCEDHGLEVRTAALEEARNDASWFFERLSNPHVPAQSPLIRRALEVALEHLAAECPAITDYELALKRAYPASLIPERVISQVRAWVADEEPGHFSVFDQLLDTLSTLHKCMRIAFENEETWLVEVLEGEREGVVALAAVALEDLDREELAGDK